MRGVAFVLSAVISIPAGSADRPARPAELRVFGFVGSMQAGEPGGRLADGGAGPAFGLGVDRWFGRNLIGSFDAIFNFIDYDLPVDLGPYAADETDLVTAWIGYVVKGVIPLGRFELFAGGGPGIGYSEASVSSNFFLFSTVRVAEENDWGIGFQALVGVDFAIGDRARLGVEYRRLDLEADFGSLTGGKIDVGGEAVVLVYRSRIGP